MVDSRFSSFKSSYHWNNFCYLTVKPLRNEFEDYGTPWFIDSKGVETIQLRSTSFVIMLYSFIATVLWSPLQPTRFHSIKFSENSWSLGSTGATRDGFIEKLRLRPFHNSLWWNVRRKDIMRNKKTNSSSFLDEKNETKWFKFDHCVVSLNTRYKKFWL